MSACKKSKQCFVLSSVDRETPTMKTKDSEKPRETFWDFVLRKIDDRSSSANKNITKLLMKRGWIEQRNLLDTFHSIVQNVI